jgi:isochorismate pyruvate lyase
MDESMKEPEACENLQDVRDACDAIDREIVALLGKRMPYVRTAVRFKRSETDIMQPDKMPAFMRERREWAADEGLDPNFVEHLYQVLVDHSFQVQLALWRAGKR